MVAMWPGERKSLLGLIAAVPITTAVAALLATRFGADDLAVEVAHAH